MRNLRQCAAHCATTATPWLLEGSGNERSAGLTEAAPAAVQWRLSWPSASPPPLVREQLRVMIEMKALPRHNRQGTAVGSGARNLRELEVALSSVDSLRCRPRCVKKGVYYHLHTQPLGEATVMSALRMAGYAVTLPPKKPESSRTCKAEPDDGRTCLPAGLAMAPRLSSDVGSVDHAGAQWEMEGSATPLGLTVELKLSAKARGPASVGQIWPLVLKARHARLRNLLREATRPLQS
mmetsp:Transcript_13397/g.31452  ORF Transcript_13397/g.31452 Transcript_13397/m.31452 type:complete len:237 (-) Transcript_13397:663-1373(-)